LIAKAHQPRYTGMNKVRFEAFSDSVFAFAITLLILAIALPAMHDPSERTLRHALLSLWPDLVAFALSFAVIGIMWQNHHALFRVVAGIDRKTVALNLLLLAGTVLIPFATSTLGSYPTMHASTFFYGLVLTYCSTSYNLLLNHLIGTRAFDDSVSSERLTRTRVAYRVGWFTYAIATLFALVVPLLSFAAYIAIAGYYFIPRGVDADVNVA
jgi:uncharacterized membrane protein